MAISLAALDAIDRISSVSLDAEGPMVTFSHSYYYCGSPSVSPKSTWDHPINNYYLTSAMVLSNVVARATVRMGAPGRATGILDSVKEHIREEDATRVRSTLTRSTRYTTRRSAPRAAYSPTPRLHPAIQEFARVISRRRTLRDGDSRRAAPAAADMTPGGVIGSQPPCAPWRTRGRSWRLWFP